MSKPCFIIAGTHSDAGKTTIALALMAVLRGRGRTVQPFKVGPDFIDPGHHTAVCGRISRNLDTWMLSESTVRDTFSRACADADVAVIEGVMGLFDGRSADDSRGSTADIARLLGVPVVLVVDAARVSSSIAAVVKGFSEFDPQVPIIGVICNNVAGARHYSYLEPAIRRHTNVVPLGWLPRRPEWSIRARHLGLTTSEDLANEGGRWHQWGEMLGRTVDVDRLLAESRSQGSGVRSQESGVRSQESGVRGQTVSMSRRVAVARDRAFCFYYPENLELLQEAGGEIVPFSPLSDTELPTNCDLVYLGGGYPELHARTLAENASMRQSLRAYHRQGGAIYAECGGLMYACRELVDVEGQVFPMLDLLPARTIMQRKFAALGYVNWRSTADSLLGPTASCVRGHEFHYSRREALGPMNSVAILQRDEEERSDGFVEGNLLAGYAHLHFGSNPAVAKQMLAR